MIRENKTYNEISVGDHATQKRVLAANDLYVFAHASGNLNPLHMPQEPTDQHHEIVAPSMWVGALISSVLGNVLPGAGTLYKSQTLTFISRAHVGDELSVTVRVVEKAPGNIVKLPTSGAWSGPVLAGNQLWSVSSKGLLAAVDPVDLIDGWFEMHAKLAPKIRRLVKILMDYSISGTESRILDDIIEKFYDEETRILSAAIRNGQKTGIFRNVHARKAAQFASTHLDGIMARSHIEPTLDIRSAVNVLREVFWAYLGLTR